MGGGGGGGEEKIAGRRGEKKQVQFLCFHCRFVVYGTQ